MSNKTIIKPLNAISDKGLNLFKEGYTIDEQAEQPDAVILRSYNMHDMTFPASLKAIGRAGAGVNNIPLDVCTEKGIPVFNTPGANANAVKELVITSLIAASRQMFDGVAWAKTLIGQGDDIPKLVETGKKQFVGKEIQGKTLGVIGLGAIGARVANDALELGMDVIGYDPFISVDMAWKLSRSVKRVHNIDELFKEVDYISIHVPLIPETKGLLNKEAFGKMKDNVYILNFSRGELVNDDDIAMALEDGTVGKYITDFPNKKTLEMTNAISIPHLGASSEESEENCAMMAAEELMEYLETGNVRNSVNFPDASLPYQGHPRVTAFHQNVPKMVSKITAEVSDANLNIVDMTNRSYKDHAYTIIDLEGDISETDFNALVGRLDAIEGMITTRVIK
ncbi:D-3-phosphoglycerate dehydrogenase [Halolactibacillus alkaliphilus]|uniref:D-3-phosphoglycerate dehydrogenase n=1 Tax=Halolactibacillus alkaliphilus TaxID=442899 RepID=A0A511X4R2_9BACI|nr:3-phosphoglycerate dehydrogenase family protein [Halolactibacillus alkaliphilus]GEN57921.1 D-3-phosphoglycerate dehydrogenase [Halolactibacillus alkaliphilus]GGN73494.1 D-3-phosphoglycerate dehydrogenase [Halolactibacillus alkaliphilus]SFO97189.1 D-3-phosphoglycerate dehydrogenase [Halolactibacillus alkaliphilus]